MLNQTFKTIDNAMYNASSEDFIPASCHYDPHTLLTKNGELLQTFEINGINAQKISKTLFNLRKVVRESIQANIECQNFAFWIHTIRRKANLDDPAEYNSYFSANIHDLWRRKNYWHDKFVNRLYVTVVHDAPAMKIRNLSTLVNSLSRDIIAGFEESFHKRASKKLNDTVDAILENLSEYGAVRLGIREEEGVFYSDLMFLYRRIMQLNEEDCLVPITDISTALSSHQYAVGTDMLEVIGDEGKKFAALMSIKEYQDVSAEALDRFLQIPVEMVATEVFYFVSEKEVTPKFEHQSFILGISKDSELHTLKGLDKIIKPKAPGSDRTQREGLRKKKEATVKEEPENINKYCHQQISFMVMGENLKELEQKIRQASNTLSKIGIVHVREDINLEKTFWAQLPGNFTFLSRMSPTILDNTAALASLHNFPTGNQHNPWGRAVTLLRTEKGTPYFANFHDSEGRSFAAIFGTHKSGRTTLMNFLLSEADKYNPTTLHIVDDLDSGIYVKARQGNWAQREKKIVNPFLVADSDETRKEVLGFLKIITNHHSNPLKEAELGLLTTVVDRAFKMENSERKLSNIIASIKDSDKGGKGLKERLAPFTEGGLYYQVFEADHAFTLYDGHYAAFNLHAFDDEAFTRINYPKDKKLIEQFEYDLETLRSVKAGIIHSLAKGMLRQKSGNPKILAIDNLFSLLNVRHYKWLVEELEEEIRNNNGVFFVTVSLEILKKLYQDKVSLDWIKIIGTKYILPPEIKMNEITEFLDLDKLEAEKLFSLSSSSRMFLIKQDGKTIASELSIGGLPGITRMLACGKMERDKYREIINEVGDDVTDWVELLYEELDSVT